jgi:hypothetical protein
MRSMQIQMRVGTALGRFRAASNSAGAAAGETGRLSGWAIKASGFTGHRRITDKVYPQ